MALTDFSEATKNSQENVSEESKMPLNETNNEENQSFFDGDIDLSATRKKRFRVNGNDDLYIELDVSDMGIINRLEELYPKLQELSQDASIKQLEMKSEDDEDNLKKISKALNKIDTTMRELIDDIFDSDVSSKCAPSGTMIDPFNGEFRFEHIIDVLTRLYTNNINSEFKKMSKRMAKRTAKYTKGK